MLVLPVSMPTAVAAKHAVAQSLALATEALETAATVEPLSHSVAQLPTTVADSSRQQVTSVGW